MPHEVDMHQNQDKVWKEALNLFKGGTLDFLGEDGLSEVITDILSTEYTETNTRKAFNDHVLKLSNNQGLHTEWEADFTTKEPKHTLYQNPSITFTPKIINLGTRDADESKQASKQKLTSLNLSTCRYTAAPVARVQPTCWIQLSN